MREALASVAAMVIVGKVIGTVLLTKMMTGVAVDWLPAASRATAVNAQDQERRRDGEYAVREGLEPSGVHPGSAWSTGSSTITGIVREVFVGYSAKAGHRSACRW